MVKAQAQALIACSPDQAFAFVAVGFAYNYPRWSPEVRSMVAVTDGPVRVGWVGRQVRVDKGRRTESEFRVVAFEDERQIVFEGLDDPFRIVYRFEPLETETRVIFDFELERLSPGLRPFAGMVRRAVQDGADRMMVRLKTLIEIEIAPVAD